MTKQALRELLAAGAEKANAEVTRSMKYEMNVESGDMSLIRTTQDVSVRLLAIKDNRKGTVALNKTDRASIDAAAKEAVALADAAQSDDANDIAPSCEPETFSAGPAAPDCELMYSRLQEFLRDARSAYPKTALDSVYFSFNHHSTRHTNSNGVDINRNFPFNWWQANYDRTPGARYYHGPEAASESETRAMVKLLSDVPYSVFVDLVEEG